MKNKDTIRKVFQTLAIILFVFQFQQSIRKYFEYPAVEHTSRIHVKDLPVPELYVCHDRQFNYTKSEDIGYSSFTNFLLGITLDGKNISWQGKDGNKTFKDLEILLLDSNYNSLSGKFFSVFENNWINIDFNKTLLFPHGVCMKPENLLQYTGIKMYSTDKSNNYIYFVDPNMANNIRTEEALDAKAYFGPTSDKFFTIGRY